MTSRTHDPREWPRADSPSYVDLLPYHSVDPEGNVDADPDAPQEALPTECEDVVIRVDEVLWFAYPKHGDDPIMTEPIPAEDLRQIVRARPRP